MYGFLRARLIDPADAEDLCQEVVLALLPRSRETEPGERSGVVADRHCPEPVARSTCGKVQRRKEVAWTEFCLELDTLASDHDEKHDEALLQLARLPRFAGPIGSRGNRAALSLGSCAWRRSASGCKRSEGAVKLLVHRARAGLAELPRSETQGTAMTDQRACRTAGAEDARGADARGDRPACARGWPNRPNCAVLLRSVADGDLPDDGLVAVSSRRSRSSPALSSTSSRIPAA